MTTFPRAPHLVVPAMIKSAVTTLAKHSQMITTLQTQATAAATLQPGSWDTISPLAGWQNVSGSVPFQARLLTTTTVQLIANLQGGATANGTVIGYLNSGFFNTVHAHTFSVTAVAGASAVSNAVSQGSLQNTGVTKGTISASQRVLIPTGNHTFNSFPITLGPSGTQFDNFDSAFTVEAQNVSNGSLNNNQTTPINYNNPAVTLGTDGSLTLSNLSSAVTHISFHEASLPLFTA